MKLGRPIKVLIVDDSALIRSMLARILAEEPDIQVVGGATDPYEARQLIIEHRPDVIILDIEMPRMDGLTFLKKLMVHYPVPVIMCSGVAPSSSRTAIEAIEAGAIDVVSKPNSGGAAALRQLGDALAEKIRAANVAIRRPPPIPATVTPAPASWRSAGFDPARYLVVAGASTGGTEALREFLSKVPADFPPVAIVQHMPEGFTYSFAGRLDQFSAMTVREAADGDILLPGRAFVARGGIQMRLSFTRKDCRIAYGSSELVNRHCPSVDVLFDSVPESSAGQTIGLLFTGMGADGARGLLRLCQLGALTIAQNKQSSIVYGMPKVAAELGAARCQCSPEEMPATILKLLRERATRREPARAS